MRLEDYYKAELVAIQQRINAYTDYGYAPELEPIVKALKKCYVEIKNEYLKINQ